MCCYDFHINIILYYHSSSIPIVKRGGIKIVAKTTNSIVQFPYLKIATNGVIAKTMGNNRIPKITPITPNRL